MGKHLDFEHGVGPPFRWCMQGRI